MALHLCYGVGEAATHTMCAKVITRTMDENIMVDLKVLEMRACLEPLDGLKSIYWRPCDPNLLGLTHPSPVITYAELGIYISQDRPHPYPSTSCDQAVTNGDN